MPVFLPQQALILMGCALVSGAFGYLYAARRERVMLDWSLSWALLGAMAVADAAFQLTHVGLVLAMSLGLGGASATLLAWGAYGMAGRRRPQHFVWVTAAVTGWAFAAELAHTSPPVAGLPATLYVGAATVTAGVAILRGTGELVPADRVAGVALIAWGVQRGLSPMFLGQPWFQPWSATVTAAFMVVGAAATVVVYYERVRIRLERGEERFRFLAEAGSDVILRRRLFPEPAWEYVSPAAERVLGYAPQAFYQDPAITDRVWDDEARATVRDMAAGGFPQHLPFLLRWSAPDGRTVWTEQTLSAIRDSDGGIWGWQAVARDVTPRVVAQQELRDSEARYASIFRDNSSVMILVDPDTGDIVDANAAAADFYGWSREELRGKPLSEVNVDPSPAVQSRVASVISGALRHFVTRHRLADGTERDVEVYTGRIPVGGQVLITGIVHDVSERAVAEQEVARYRERLEELVDERTRELLEANAALAQATRVKSEFLANVSHELRTPLNSIIGFSTVMLRGMAGELSEEQRTQLEMVQRAGKHLLELVNDLLDISRIEMGALRPEGAEFDVAAAVGRLAESIRPLCAEKGLVLDTRLPEEPVTCRTDKRHIEQILLNLLSNAVKFTQSGGITVSIDADPVNVAIAVSDTGPGLPPGEERRVFDQFVQFPVHGDAKPDGTGLGLAISSKLAKALGGRLEVTSGEGGATFTLSIPRQLPAEPAGNGV